MQFVKYTILIIFAFLLGYSSLALTASAQTFKTATLHVAGFSDKQIFYDQFRRELAAQKKLQPLDDDLARAAAAGLKLENLFNLSLDEAKNFGAAADCNYFFIVKEDTLRRSSFAKEFYFESSAIIFLASARTGHLIAWEHASAEEDAAEAAEKRLLAKTEEIAARFFAKIVEADARERAERAQKSDSTQILEISGAVEEADENSDLRIPLPYKRLQPAYTAAAQKAEAQATVDVMVELNAEGAVQKAEIARWAGFGLDEETAATVKKMQFRAALKNGAAVPARFLLRYNFRRPRDK